MSETYMSGTCYMCHKIGHSYYDCPQQCTVPHCRYYHRQNNHIYDCPPYCPDCFNLS